MIEYHYEFDFKLDNEQQYTNWLVAILKGEKRAINHINYVFCGDDYLFEMNVKHLKHNTLTDILTFDYSQGNDVQADIFISVERVSDNANDLHNSFSEELLRVMAHGVLHIVGYKDKTDEERAQMRLKEDETIKMFHVEQ